MPDVAVLRPAGHVGRLSKRRRPRCLFRLATTGGRRCSFFSYQRGGGGVDSGRNTIPGGRPADYPLRRAAVRHTKTPVGHRCARWARFLETKYFKEGDEDGGGEGRRKYQERVCDEKPAQRAQRRFQVPDACRTGDRRAEIGLPAEADLTLNPLAAEMMAGGGPLVRDDQC